jgi:hypothetical protein
MTNLNVNPNTNTTISPAPISKLEEKLAEWIGKIKSADPDYFAIATSDDKMFYLSGKRRAEILSFDMLIDKGHGFERALLYHKNIGTTSTANTPITIIVKKEKRLIANLNNNIFGFGLKYSNNESETKNLLIHFETAHMHTFIAANDKADAIEIFYALISNTAFDPVSNCLKLLFAQ